LPNKSGVVCKKAYILFVVKKELEWQGKKRLITNQHVTYYHLIPHTIRVPFRSERYTKNRAFPL